MARISVLAFLLCVVSATGCAGIADQTAHSVRLNWGPSTSVVVGYYVYRSTTSSEGPWIRLSASVDTALSYTDSTVQGGQVYFYAVSAVSFNGRESDLSNVVLAEIPFP
jgi:fibronectin type 3 domain-containing protein